MTQTNVTHGWSTSQHAAISRIRKSLGFSYGLSLIVTLLDIAVISYFQYPNPAIACLIAVAFSSYWAGFGGGALSGVLSVIYCVSFFSANGTVAEFANESLLRLVVFILSIAGMVFMVGTLKKRLAERTRELQLAVRQLVLLSNVDYLTSVSNRQFFEQSVRREWQRNRRTRMPISIVLLDVDRFGKYNETYGQLEGDACIRKLADALAKRMQRPSDLIARYGEEEFAILLPDTQLTGALNVARDLRLLIADLQIANVSSDVSPYLTVSIGIASEIPAADGMPEDFEKKAVMALSEAKRSGGNAVRVFGEQSGVEQAALTQEAYSV